MLILQMKNLKLRKPYKVALAFMMEKLESSQSDARAATILEYFLAYSYICSLLGSLLVLYISSWLLLLEKRISIQAFTTSLSFLSHKTALVIEQVLNKHLNE